MPDTSPDDGADAELDAAILAHDQARTAYIIRQRVVRRIMGVSTFVVWLVGNVAMITAALLFDDVAHRLAIVVGVIGSFEMAATGVIAMYWGAGAFDNRTMLGGGMAGGMYAGGMGGGSMYGGGMSAPGVRPRLVRTTTPAADDEPSGPKRSPDGEQ